MNWKLYDEIMSGYASPQDSPVETPQGITTVREPSGVVGLTPEQAQQAREQVTPKQPIPVFDTENYPEYGDESSIPQQPAPAEAAPDESIIDQLLERSWGAAAYRKASRMMDPAKEKEWRSNLLDTWKAKGWNISKEEEDAWKLTGELPVGLAEQKSLEETRQKAAIAAAGGQVQVLSDYIKNNPGEFLKEFAMGVAADPWMLGLPAIYKGVFQGLVKSGASAYKAAAAGVGAEAAVGGGLAAGGEALLSQEQEGEVSPSRVGTAAALAGGVGGLVGLAQTFGATKRAGAILAAKTGKEASTHTAEIFLYMEKNRVSLEEATKAVMELHKVDPTGVLSELRTATTNIAKQLEDEGFAPGPASAMEGPNRAPMGAAPVPKPSTIGPVRPAEVYESGVGGTPAGRLQAAQEGRATPMPVNRGEGYGLIEDKPARDMSQWTPPGREPRVDSSALAADIERIAWKERSAVFNAASKKGMSPSDELFTSTAFAPNKGAVTKPVLTLKEFSETSLGKSVNGTPLRGAALQKRWEKWHRDLQKANRDPNMVVTQDELRSIMMENSATMRDFFLKAGRKAGTRENQIPKKFRGKESGFTTQDFTTLLGAGAFAAMIGYGKRHDIADAVLYTALATGSLLAGGKILNAIAKASPVTQHMIKVKKGANLDNLLNEFEGSGAVYERELKRRREAVRTLSGERGLNDFKAHRAALKLREQVTDALEDKTGKLYNALSPAGKEVYKYAETYLADMAEFGTREGILDSTIENYVPHAWQHATRSETAKLDALFGTQTRRKAMDTIHKETRKIPTYSFGKKAGLTPRTMDIAEILTMYGKSMDQAYRSKILFDTLKKTKSSLDNTNLIITSQKAPKNYVEVNHPKFRGYLVHPDVAPSLRSIFGSSDFGAMYRGVLGLNFLLKRQSVSLSGFHAKALIFSHIMANASWKNFAHPIQTMKDVKDFTKIFSGESYALRMFRDTANSSVSKEIDEGLRAGLTVNLVDDVGGDTFYDAMTDFTGFLDKTYNNRESILGKAVTAPLKGAGYGVKGLKSLNKYVDTVMWDRLYTSMKLQTYLNKMEILSAKHGDSVPLNQLREAAAEFTNDAFGGMNWTRMARKVETRVGSNLAHQLAGRSGRAFQQIALFAPDWTTSQIRIFYKAFANKNPIQRALYQRYQYTGLIMFFTAMDMLNQAFSGKHFWENEDPATVDMGDGRRWSLSKQYFEPAKWLWKPQQSAMNKLATLPRSGIEFMMGQEYLRHGGMGPPIENYATWAAKKALPIWGQAAFQSGPAAGLAGMAGFPIYGEESSSSGLSGLGRKW